MVLEVAARIKERDEEAAESFARWLMPWPGGWLAAALDSDSAEVPWVNRPADGLLRGLVFGDGSSFCNGFMGLARAGWALVMVDAAGRLISAAYGAAPIDRSPRQTSRDAEDLHTKLMADIDPLPDPPDTPLT